MLNNWTELYSPTTFVQLVQYEINTKQIFLGMPHISADCSSKRFTFTTDLFYNHSKVMLPDNTDLYSCLMKCLKISFLEVAQLPCAFLVKLWFSYIQSKLKF